MKALKFFQTKILQTKDSEAANPGPQPADPGKWICVGALTRVESILKEDDIVSTATTLNHAK